MLENVVVNTGFRKFLIKKYPDIVTDGMLCPRHIFDFEDVIFKLDGNKLIINETGYHNHVIMDYIKKLVEEYKGTVVVMY